MFWNGIEVFTDTDWFWSQGPKPVEGQPTWVDFLIPDCVEPAMFAVISRNSLVAFETREAREQFVPIHNH